MKIERTFKDKVLDLIYYAALREEFKWRDGEGTRHFHRMEMCVELGDKIKELIELDSELKKLDKRYKNGIEEMEENDGNRTENR